MYLNHPHTHSLPPTHPRPSNTSSSQLSILLTDSNEPLSPIGVLMCKRV